MTVPSLPTVDPDLFRHVVGHFASGVAVLTSSLDGKPAGMTVSAVSSLSLDPPMLLVCVNRAVPTEQAIVAAGSFCVNVLAEGQSDIAAQFARPSSDKFAGLAHTPGPLGNPSLSAALAQIECRVAEQVPAGSHTVFLGEVVDARAREGLPLTYFRGGFGRFLLDRFDEVYRQVRQQILRRQMPSGRPIDLGALGSQLDAEPAAITAALATLRREGLVQSDPDHGYSVAPFDISAASDAFTARSVIELGVAELVTESVTEDQLRALDALLAELSGFIVDDEFTDFKGYLRANDDLHRYLVGLAGNASSVRLYESLALPVVMDQSFGSTSQSSGAFVQVHVDLVDGLHRRNTDDVKRAIRRYAELAIERARTLLDSSGGSV